jgi:peptidoglycan-N-acetylglucosamine deacetylase
MPIGKLFVVAAVVLAIAAPAAGTVRSASVPHAPHAYHSRTAIEDPADVGPGLDIRTGSLSQTGREVSLSVTTWHPLRAKRLGARDGTTLCVALAKAHKQLCLRDSRRAVVVSDLDAAGKPSAPKRVPATVRFGPRSVTATLDLGTAGLDPGRVAWQLSATSHAAACGPTGTCLDLAPDARQAVTRLAAVRLVGCRVPHKTLYRHGSRRRRAVALTFDDGPSSYSHSVVAILRREHVHATFFLIGRQVHARAETARSELAAGNVLGDHSWNHADLAVGGSRAAGQIAETQRAIARATGFVPCLFRPPGGAVSSSLVSVARSYGAATINWDVDPRDWSRPGTSSIYSTIVNTAQRGSIVLMHDGGGPRSQTVAALPHVIHTLRRRGYAFLTVPELLGGSLIYGR